MLNDNGKTEAETYDPRKRDPQFAHAASSPLWELVRVAFFFLCILYRSLPKIDPPSPPLPPRHRSPRTTASLLTAFNGKCRPLPEYALSFPRPVRVQEPQEAQGW